MKVDVCLEKECLESSAQVCFGSKFKSKSIICIFLNQHDNNIFISFLFFFILKCHICSLIVFSSLLIALFNSQVFPSKFDIIYWKLLNVPHIFSPVHYNRLPIYSILKMKLKEVCQSKKKKRKS